MYNCHCQASIMFAKICHGNLLAPSNSINLALSLTSNYRNPRMCICKVFSYYYP